MTDSAPPTASDSTVPVASPFLLQQDLDIRAAENLLTELRERRHLAELQIDGRAVERITTPCVQLLLAAMRTAEASEKSCRIHPSEAMCEAFADLGLSAELQARSIAL